MSSSKTDLLTVAKAIRMDLTNCQQRLSELMREIAALSISEPAAAICPACGLKLAGPNTLAEHMYVSHSGSFPPTWKRTDDLAA